MSEDKRMPGGGFLLETANPEDIFTPEDFTSEQLMYAKTANDFMEKDVLAVSDRIEVKEEGLTLKLIAKAGELGLLMADIPEEYGGMGLDKPSSALITEKMSAQGSFSVVFGAQTGIGTLPIVYYGTEELKKKYLPILASGSQSSCYCLTEASAGSDALSGRTKAVLSEDGEHYILNGVKQFITNGAIATIFIVFAKIDGEHFTGFVLERGMEGLSHGPEEHKMGIVGSSTTTVILEDVKVPVGNVLGEIGKGHKIAFNILNIGRFKLGVGTVGAAKRVLGESLAYSLERKQFGEKIAEFGMIREKMAEMYVRIYASEAACYRTIGYIDDLMEQGAHGETALKAIEEYSVECAIVKVLGSETLDYVADENVQIFGGYGYSAEYPAEMHYRDSRINRIFEGTNEINRLLIPAMLLRKGMKGELPLFQAAKALADELMDIPSFDMDEEERPLSEEAKIAANIKKMCLFVAGTAAQKYGPALEKHQELLARAADLAILAYLADSAVLRAQKDLNKRGDKAAIQVAAARVACETAVTKAEGIAREAIAAMAEGDTLVTMLSALRRLSRRTPADIIALRDMITTKMVEDERTPFMT